VLIPGEIEVTDSVSPNDDLAVSFAGTEENTSSGSETVTLANLGSEVLTVSGLQLTGADANEFSFDVSAGSNPCGGLAIVINGSSSCTVGVTFSPTTIGTKSANLEITSDDADEATINVALNGTGITAGGGNTASDGGGGGCTVSKSGQSRLDPLFPLMLLACAWYLTNIRRGTRKD